MTVSQLHRYRDRSGPSFASAQTRWCQSMAEAETAYALERWSDAASHAEDALARSQQMLGQARYRQPPAQMNVPMLVSVAAGNVALACDRLGDMPRSLRALLKGARSNLELYRCARASQRLRDEAVSPLNILMLELTHRRDADTGGAVRATIADIQDQVRRHIGAGREAFAPAQPGEAAGAPLPAHFGGGIRGE